MPESIPSRPGWITLARDLRGRDRHGREHLVKLIEIEAQAYIPDVYVRWDHDVMEDQLFDDNTFVAFVNDALKAIGYEGQPLDRAELGLQGRNFIVLEPPRAFAQFATQRYGWRDLDLSARAF